MDRNLSGIDLDNYLDFQTRSERYRKSFNSKAFPYELPRINYLGSFIPDSENSSQAEIYIGIPIKNQGQVIFQILNALFESMSCDFSLGVVFDNCTDNTKQEVLRFISERAKSHKKLKRFDLLSSDGELFEATCENVLFQFCQEKYFMSLQADIHMTDDSFVERSFRAFDQNSHLLGISGRAIVGYGQEQKMAHNLGTRLLINLPNLIAPRIWMKKRLGPATSRIGYFGDISRPPLSSMQFSAAQLMTLYPGQAIIRGPIIWRAQFFEQLSGYDDLAYFLGRDDCDLSLRGRLQFKYFVGYLPCRSYSNPLEGTTRKPRTPEAMAELQNRADLANRFLGSLSSLWAGKLEIKLKPKSQKRIRLR